MLSFSVQTQDSQMRLTGALLVYTADGRENGSGNSRHRTMATVHNVETVEDRPTIMPGRLLSEADLVNLTQGLVNTGTMAQTRWLDTTVLARGPDRLVWWTPPGQRPMFFEASRYNDKTFTGQGVCPVPGLVWLAKFGAALYVYAVDNDLRPTPDTSLYQAPFFNVWGNGQVCLGNVALPQDQNREHPAAYEQVLFGSRFTHPNFAEPDRLVKGIEPIRFWSRMVARPTRRFPTERLVRVPLKVGELLESDAASRVNAWPRPQGQF